MIKLQGTLVDLSEAPPPPEVTCETGLDRIRWLDASLLDAYGPRMAIDPRLTRQLVSFQANKVLPGYRWFKYKEAFSASLVEHLLSTYCAGGRDILDPFAGMGTTLFAARDRGMRAVGIELLPVGQAIIEDRLEIEAAFDETDYEAIRAWITSQPWRTSDITVSISALRITQGAFPEATTKAIERYLGAMSDEPSHIRCFLRLALLSILESVSYTRKDGQYLRWDQRAGRRIGVKPFDKGHISTFDEAITAKVAEMLLDLEAKRGLQRYWLRDRLHGSIDLLRGSCLDLMPGLPACSCDAIITSPPYCNRYDYTRTYALELAVLGVGEKGLTALRQAMLSCTVENRGKDLLSFSPAWRNAILAADQQDLLQSILLYLESERDAGRLNNTGIPRMVRGYFYEMSCVLWECARVLRPGAALIMVNDNVRYAGASISVDMILSELAQQFGLSVEQILVLPGDKGNSSQQMGEHGRDPLRKCVYMWRKT
jgi:DNA modification methylase